MTENLFCTGKVLQIRLREPLVTALNNHAREFKIDNQTRAVYSLFDELKKKPQNLDAGQQPLKLPPVMYFCKAQGKLITGEACLQTQKYSFHVCKGAFPDAKTPNLCEPLKRLYNGGKI